MSHPTCSEVQKAAREVFESPWLARDMGRTRIPMLFRWCVPVCASIWPRGHWMCIRFIAAEVLPRAEGAPGTRRIGGGKGRRWCGGRSRATHWMPELMLHRR